MQALRMQRTALLVIAAFALAASSGSAVAEKSEHNPMPGEVLTAFGDTATRAQIDALQRRLRLTLIEQQSLQLTGTTLYCWRIPDRRAAATALRALKREAMVASAQPNYRFALQ